MTLRDLIEHAERNNIDLDEEIQIGVEFDRYSTQDFTLKFDGGLTEQPAPTIWITRESVAELVSRRFLG